MASQNCSNAFPNDMSKNVPRDVLSFSGDENSATECVQKCLYWYNYAAASSCVVTNETDRLSIKYDGGGDVTFNTATYTPTWVRIFSPSIHKYNGSQAEAELIIEHTAKSASMAGLLVCIPLSKDGVKTGGSEVVETILANAPVIKNVAETVSVSDFSLNRLIPTAPYFTYSGPLPYDACAPDTIYQYVVFHPSRKGTLAIDVTQIARLQEITSYSYIVAYRGNDVFYNPKGTSSNGFNGEDQIYIQCQPAGEDKEEKVYKEPKAPAAGNGNMNEILSTIIYIVIGIVAIYVAFMVMKALMGFVSIAPKEVKIVTGGAKGSV
jgi:hypothetical protein